MSFSGLTYAWPFFLSTLVSAGLIVYAWRRRRMRTAWYFKALMIFAAGWSLSSAIYIMAGDTTAKLLWVDLKYVFVVGLPVGWILLAVAFAGRIEAITLRRTVLLFVIPVLTVGLVSTNSIHGLVFTRSFPVLRGGLVSVAREFGPWFWVHMIYSYLLIIVGFGIFLRQVICTRGFYRRQSLVMLLGAIIPFVYNALYLANPARFDYLDCTPVAFAASGLIFAVGLFKFGLLDVVPIARTEVVKGMDDPVIVVDSHMRIVDVNVAAIELFRLDRGGNVGEPLVSVIPRLSEVESQLVRLHRFHEDLLIETEDGDVFWYDCRSKELRAKSGDLRGWVLVLRDVTDLKEAAFQSQRAKEKAEELSTLKSTFLSSMSHEIRTPLAGIIGLADVLQSETEGEHQEFARMIRDGGNRLLRTLSSVLSVSMLSSGRLTSNHSLQDVRRICRRVIAGFSDLAHEKGLQLEFNIPMKAIMADFDEAHLEQALSHIFHNAVKFTDRGQIELTLGQVGDMIEIVVSDSGIGIDAEFRQTMFEAFTRSSAAMEREADGSGLGLRVAKGLIEEMGGRVDVESTPGVGSRFTLSFPEVYTSTTDRPSLARSPDRDMMKRTNSEDVGRADL